MKQGLAERDTPPHESPPPPEQAPPEEPLSPSAPEDSPAAETTASPAPAEPATERPPAPVASDPFTFAEDSDTGSEEDEEDLGKLMDAMEIKKGDIVSGTVAQIDEDGIRVDIGTKAEGLIPREELDPDYAEEIKVGDSLDVYVLKVETDEGYPLLSKSRADYHRLWNELEESMKTGKVLTTLVKDRVKGGLIVDVGVDGFVPASHTTSDTRRRPGNLDRFVGRTLRVKVIECDRKRNRVVLSHRVVVDEERQRRQEETLKKIEPGAALTGVVRRITNFGAFIDLGGIDGLLHISEMSWTRIQHPSEVVKKGDKVQVVVLKWDPETKRISLGMRQLLKDPWKGAAKKYKVGSTVKCTITRTIRNGAFARLESGIEGIIPLSELAEGRINSVEEVVHVGDEVEARVLQVREAQRKISLSLREAQQARERNEYRSFLKNQSNGSVTLGDVFGELLNGVKTVDSSGETRRQAAPQAGPKQERATPEASIQKPEGESSPAPKPADAQPEAGTGGSADPGAEPVAGNPPTSEPAAEAPPAGETGATASEERSAQ